MKKNTRGDKRLSVLRKKAVKKMSSSRATSDAEMFTEAEHELNVHKVELEMQNEELLSMQSKLVISIDEYTQLFDHAPVGYYILNEKGVIVNLNLTACAQLGMDRKKLIGKNLSVFLTNKTYQDNFYRHKSDLRESEKTLPFECEMNCSDGSKFSALIESKVVKDEKKKFKHYLCTVSDISEQKVQEHLLELALMREKELNQLKSQFVTIASHEFRTPLSTIMTSAELMEKYNSPADADKKKKHLHRISNAVSRLKEILIDFLSVEEVEKGSIKNSPVTFDLVTFTEKLIEEVRSFNGTHYVTYKHVGKFGNVFLDQKLLKTVMSNLLINAYKYSPDGGNIEVITEQKKVGSILISVKDEGIGIPKNEGAQVFEQFFRAKNAEKIQGTGLGLHIVKKMVTLMGGSVSFESEEKKGSTFYIKF